MRCGKRPAMRVFPHCGLRPHMFRRRTAFVLNSRQWFSHRSGPRKSSYALTRGAVVVTSVAAVAAATIASIGGSSIHNDASSPNVTTAASGKVIPGTRVRINYDDDDELRLLVWGSNRYVSVAFNQLNTLVLPFFGFLSLSRSARALVAISLHILFPTHII
jgi:hypothetical protein